MIQTPAQNQFVGERRLAGAASAGNANDRYTGPRRVFGFFFQLLQQWWPNQLVFDGRNHVGQFSTVTSTQNT